MKKNNGRKESIFYKKASEVIVGVLIAVITSVALYFILPSGDSKSDPRIEIDQSSQSEVNEDNSVVINTKIENTTNYTDAKENQDVIIEEEAEIENRPKEGQVPYTQPMTIRVPEEHKNARIYVDDEWISNAPNEIQLSKGTRTIKVVGDSLFYEERIVVPSPRRSFINITEQENKY